MTYVTKFPDAVPAGGTIAVTVTITDHLGVALESGALETITYDLWDVGTGNIVNTREDVDASGMMSGNVLTVELTPDDTELLDPVNNAIEQRVVLVTWTWLGGARQHFHEVHVTVQRTPPQPMG